MNNPSNIKSGISFIWRHLGMAPRWGLLVATVTIALAAWLNSMIPVLLGDLASGAEAAIRSSAGISLEYAKVALWSLFGCFLGRELANMVRKYIVHRITTTSERNMASTLIGHLLRLDLATLRGFQSGALQGRIRRCVDGYVRLLKLSFMDFVPAILTAGFAVAMALNRNGCIGGLILLSLPFLFLAVYWQGRSQQGIRVSLLRSKEQMEGTIAEQLAGIEYIRCADTHELEESTISDKAESLRKVEMKHHSAMGGFDFLKAMIESVFFVAVTGLSIWLAGGGHIAVGEIVTSSMLFASVLGPVREIHRIIDEAAESSLSVSDFREMLGLPQDGSFGDCSSVAVDTVARPCAIEADGLEIGYGGPSGKSHILNGMTVTIPAGQVVGIVGKTGCGKSTFLRALVRLIHPTGGQLTVFGIPIGNLSRKRISNLLGVVSQNPFIRSGSIQDNVMYGSTNTSVGDVHAAIAKAALTADLNSLEGGLAHQVTEGGNNLAGGQRQRLAIARALFQPKPIMIFDEATSALDNMSEAKVLRSIMALRGGSTVLMIAHRLSTLRDVDRILVFSGGKVIEDGPYATLVAAGGVFADLVKASESDADQNMPRQLS
jgi:ATP-binding cassette subfamily B protein